ncbi:MAG: lanthionine synthetase LanC family protein [Candidatus Nanopelagicales bacterium]
MARTAATYRELGESAWSWTLAQVRDDDGPWLPEHVDGSAAQPLAVERDMLYCGIAGLAPLLRELRLHRDLSADESSLASAVVERLSRESLVSPECGLYLGRAGHAYALALLGADAGPALAALAGSVGELGWPDPEFSYVTDVVGGTAGIVLAGCLLGGEAGLEVASLGADRLLRTSRTTDAGLEWVMAPEYDAVMPNLSHGTAGASAALAVAGAALGRPDLVDAAVAGTRHLLSLADRGGGGFELPMIIPPQEDRELVTFGWCHGPTGTSVLFPALELAGVDEVDGITTTALRAGCVTSILRSGLPERVRPGFWDNDGRCCGTAGVGEMLLDAAQASADPAYADEVLASAVVMADAIADRAITDEQGTRWRFVEHRNDDPLLAPNTSWMQGSAGIAAFLLRLARVLDDGLAAPVVPAPDRWWTVPAGVRAPLSA